MSGSPQTYRTIPSTEDQAHPPHGVREVRLDGDNFSSRSEWISASACTKGTYFLLGCAILLPWNALVSGTSFFLSRLTGSPFYPLFGSYLSSVYALTKLVCQFYCTITSKQSSSPRRIFVSIIAMILFMISLCLSTYIHGTPSTFFSFALFSSASLAASSAYLCTATYAGASLLGASFLQSMLSGQSAIAVVVSAVQLASSMASIWGSSPKSDLMEVESANGTEDEDEQAGELAARIFFSLSAVFLVIAFTAYARLTRQPFYKSAICNLEQHHETEDSDELTRLVADDCTNTGAISTVHRNFQKNSIFMFSVAYVFTVTLAVFPAITMHVHSINPSTHPLMFTAIHILVFNVGDLLGRYTCSFPRLLIWSAKRILVMSVSRTLFIPLVLLCNIQRPGTNTTASPIINSDTLYMMILLTMGYTNGYVSVLAILTVSSVEHNPKLKGRRADVDVAATLAGFFMIVGLTFGALCSFGVQAMI